MDERKDPPIDPQDFIAGVTVIDIGDIRVKRGLSRRPNRFCYHKKMTYDIRERRIWCAECERDVDPFDAFMQIAEQLHNATQALDLRLIKLREAENASLHLLAAREMEKAWRSRTMVPACPACGNGLFPEDFKNGAAAGVGREYAMARRRGGCDEK